MSNTRIVVHWLRNSLTGFVLILFAIAVSGVVQSVVPFEYPKLYPVWFVAALIPFYKFARSRGALCAIEWPDVFVFAPPAVVFAFWPHQILPQQPGGIFAVALVASSFIGHWLRQRFVSQMEQS